MTNKLTFPRDHSAARPFEHSALKQIWVKGQLDGQYTPDPIDEFDLEAAALSSTEGILSVFFLITYNDVTNIEIAIGEKQDNFEYGGQIPLIVDEEPVGLKFLDPIIENSVKNGYKVISTMGEGERVDWAYNAKSKLYTRE